MADNNKSVSGKKQAPKQKKPNFFVATFSELKQVSWPTFGDTMKRLAAVLAITVIFLVVLMAIDILLQWIHTEDAVSFSIIPRMIIALRREGLVMELAPHLRK